MTIAVKRRHPIIELSCFLLQKTLEQSEPKALEARLILRSMSGRSLRSLEMSAPPNSVEARLKFAEGELKTATRSCQTMTEVNTKQAAQIDKLHT